MQLSLNFQNITYYLTPTVTTAAAATPTATPIIVAVR